MSSEITYAPIIPVKTTEEIIEEYNQEIRLIEGVNKEYKLSRNILKSKICDLKKNIKLIGKNHKVEKIDFTTITKTTTSGVSFEFSLNLDDVSEDVQDDNWFFEENIEEKRNRYIEYLKDCVCETEKDANEVRELIVQLDNSEDVNEELIRDVNSIVNKKTALSMDAVSVLREYTMIQMISGSDNVFSYEEAIKEIDNARNNVKKIIIKDYKKNIIKEACDYVGIQLMDTEFGDQASFCVEGIDDCEIEMTFFEQGGIMLETVGVIDAVDQQSLDEKRKTVENAKELCSKIQQMEEYIRDTYPDVKLEMESIKIPSEHNMNTIVREKTREKKRTHKKKYMNMED